MEPSLTLSQSKLSHLSSFVAGVVVLLLYSIFGLGSLCLLCSGFYVFSLASCFMFWKYGIDRDRGFPAGWIRPSVKHLVTYAVIALVDEHETGDRRFLENWK